MKMKSTGKKILNAVKFAACLALVACMTFTQTAKATEVTDVTGGSFLTAAETTVNNTCIEEDHTVNQDGVRVRLGDVHRPWGHTEDDTRPGGPEVPQEV